MFFRKRNLRVFSQMRGRCTSSLRSRPGAATRKFLINLVDPSWSRLHFSAFLLGFWGGEPIPTHSSPIHGTQCPRFWTVRFATRFCSCRSRTGSPFSSKRSEPSDAVRRVKFEKWLSAYSNEGIFSNLIREAVHFFVTNGVLDRDSLQTGFSLCGFFRFFETASLRAV